MRNYDQFSGADVLRREEVFAGKDTQFNPTVGAGGWLKQGLRLRASVGRAYRLPAYTDVFCHDPRYQEIAGVDIPGRSAVFGVEYVIHRCDAAMIS